MAKHIISLFDGTAVSASTTETFENYSNVYESLIQKFVMCSNTLRFCA